MNNSKIIEFAKAFGYDGAKYRGEWKHYSVYEPTSRDKSMADVGKPEFIFVLGERAIMASEKEAFEFIDSLPEE